MALSPRSVTTTPRSDTIQAHPTDDPLFGKGRVRADGRKIHDVYLFEVKKPEKSNGPWETQMTLQGRSALVTVAAVALAA